MSQRKKKLKVKMQLSSASNEHLASLKWLNSPHIDELFCLAFNPPPPLSLFHPLPYVKSQYSFTLLSLLTLKL